jgi:predicted site-specific integrase-resolvase
VGTPTNLEWESVSPLIEQVFYDIIDAKDRLVRFGYDWFEMFCQKYGAEIVVMNVESLSPEAELTQDLLSIIHGFSSRLPGLRKYQKQITQYLEANENHQASQPATE